MGPSDEGKSITQISLEMRLNMVIKQVENLEDKLMPFPINSTSTVECSKPCIEPMENNKIIVAHNLINKIENKLYSILDMVERI